MTDRRGSFSDTERAEDDATLLREIAALPRAMRPERDPWPQIRQRISAAGPGIEPAGLSNPRRGMPIGWAVAATVLLAAFSALLVLRGVDSPAPEHTPMAGNDRPANSVIVEPRTAGAPLPTSSAEMEYQAAFREFARLDLSQSVVSDQARDAMLQDWAVMRQLEQDLLVALEQEPDSVLLQDRWMQLRASQLQLLHVIAEAGQLPGRTLI